jgi:hypothetical protein
MSGMNFYTFCKLKHNAFLIFKPGSWSGGIWKNNFFESLRKNCLKNAHEKKQQGIVIFNQKKKSNQNGIRNSISKMRRISEKLTKCFIETTIDSKFSSTFFSQLKQGYTIQAESHCTKVQAVLISSSPRLKITKQK